MWIVLRWRSTGSTNLVEIRIPKKFSVFFILFEWRTDRKFLRNPNLNEIKVAPAIRTTVAPVSYYCLIFFIGLRPKLGNTYYRYLFNLLDLDRIKRPKQEKLVRVILLQIIGFNFHFHFHAMTCCRKKYVVNYLFSFIKITIKHTVCL